MPSFGGNLGNLPKPAAPRGLGAGLGAAVSHAGAAVQHAAQQVHPTAIPKGPGGDIQTSGPGYGSRQANAYKQSPGYKQAIVSVFAHQPVAQKKAIVAGAVKAPHLAESKIILHYLSSQPQRTLDSSGRMHLTEANKLLAPYQGGAAFSLSGLEKSLSAHGPFNFEHVKTPGGGSYSTVGTAALFGGKGGNAAKDLVSLPGSALSTIGTIGGDVAGGHIGKAISDVIDPYVQLAEHPWQMLSQHPLLSYLMASGALHGATRLAAAPARALADESSAAGKTLSTNREGVALTGNLTHERPPYSKSPTVKAQQKLAEANLYTRAPTGELIPKSEWLRKHQLNQEIGSLVGTRERIRVVNRELVRQAREKAITPGKAARAGKSAKTALAYGPRRAVVPGADVLARIADGTIRRPDTYTQDLLKHIAKVSANRPTLLGDKLALAAHDEYVKALQKEADKNRTPASLQRAFKAADAYAREYPVTESAAANLGHFGPMDRTALQLQALSHYAVSHLGAHRDPVIGLVDANGKRLTPAEILAHVKGPEGTGGRIPAFTSDRVRFDREQAARGANYVSGERRPLPVPNKKNMLYAYTHGLTHPGHEALTEQHVLMQGILDAHGSQNAYMHVLHTQLPGGGYAKTYGEAARRINDAGIRGYKPINIAQIFHPADSLSKAIEGVHPATAEEEAMRHSLDLSARTKDMGATPGRWAMIDEHALRVLRQHDNQISPNTVLRSIRGLNNQFRSVALSTSAKHIPGVAFENLLRDIAHGVGFRSWVTGRRILGTMDRIDSTQAREARTQVAGGQVAGMTQAGKTYMVSDHWAGTTIHPFLKAFEVASKTPGTRQLRTTWRAWTKFVIQGTKHVLEEQHQIAGLGKTALREHGYAEAAKTAGMLGLIKRAFGLHGQMLEDAARGMFDPRKLRQTRAAIDQIYGKWTDLSPSAQTALMFSPFGLWWANSAKFLARMPIDQPVKTSLLASATAGTQKERQAVGLDMYGPGALPAYMQGGIPLGGGKVLAQNYYSPFGVANDPLATAQSLIQPWATPFVTGALGVNWLGKPLSSPSNPHGAKPASVDQKVQYILDSALSSFVPLYMKATQVAHGGASAYDVNDSGLNPIAPTKTPGKGTVAGLKKAFQPFREYQSHGSSSGGSGYFGGSSSSSSSGSSSGSGYFGNGGSSSSSSSSGSGYFG